MKGIANSHFITYYDVVVVQGMTHTNPARIFSLVVVSSSHCALSSGSALMEETKDVFHTTMQSLPKWDIWNRPGDTDGYEHPVHVSPHRYPQWSVKNFRDNMDHGISFVVAERVFRLPGDMLPSWVLSIDSMFDPNYFGILDDAWIQIE